MLLISRGTLRNPPKLLWPKIAFKPWSVPLASVSDLPNLQISQTLTYMDLFHFLKTTPWIQAKVLKYKRDLVHTEVKPLWKSPRSLMNPIGWSDLATSRPKFSASAGRQPCKQSKPATKATFTASVCHLEPTIRFWKVSSAPWLWILRELDSGGFCELDVTVICNDRCKTFEVGKVKTELKKIFAIYKSCHNLWQVSPHFNNEDRG